MKDINPVKPPIGTPILTENLVHMLWIIFGIIFFLLVILVIYYFVKKRRAIIMDDKLHKKEDEELKIDYHKKAKEKLDLCRKYIDNNNYKMFYFELTEAIKEYLSYVYGKNFLDMTTREMLSCSELPQDVRDKVKNILNLSDLAKFAQSEQEKNDAIASLDIAYKILD